MNKSKLVTLTSIVIGGVVGILLATTSVYGASLPKYDGYVTDLANVLEDSVEKELESKITEYEKATSNEIAVLIIETLPENYDLESYSVAICEDWKPGKADKDNGILLTMATKESSGRRMRIEIGEGLEGVITDRRAGEILDTCTVPHYKAGEFQLGVVKTVDCLTRELSEATKSAGTTEDTGTPTWVLVVVLFIVIIIILAVVTSGDDSDGGIFGSSSGGSGKGFGGGGFGGGGASR